MYNLGGTDLSIFNFTPTVEAGSDVALSGFLDMPSRLGKTSHNWASEDGEEPYISAADIALGGFSGRILVLIGVIRGTDQYDANDKVNALHALIDSFTGFVSFATDWKNYQVCVNEAVVGEKLASGLVKIAIPMIEPVVSLVGTIPTPTSAQFGIDGISFSQLGGVTLQLSGDRLTRPTPKKEDVTVYGKESVVITKKQSAVLNLQLAIKDSTISGLLSKVQTLMALFSNPGLRQLTYEGDRLRSFYVKDGFKASNIHLYTNEKFCVIDVKLIDAGVAGTFTSLTDTLGQLITDNTNNIITVRI